MFIDVISGFDKQLVIVFATVGHIGRVVDRHIVDKEQHKPKLLDIHPIPFNRADNIRIVAKSLPRKRRIDNILSQSAEKDVYPCTQKAAIIFVDFDIDPIREF